MRHLKRGTRKVFKKRRIRLTSAMRDVEHNDNTQMDELYRLSQEDMFHSKKGHISAMEERKQLIDAGLNAEAPLLERARIQAAKGNPDNVTEDNYYDKALLARYHRRVSNLSQDIDYELATMQKLKESEEDDEARRRRRNSQFNLNEYDEEAGYPEEGFIIPDTGKEYQTPLMSVYETFADAVEAEGEMIDVRAQSRRQMLKKRWALNWRQYGAKTSSHKPTLYTRMLRRFSWLRNRWDDDDRCWRTPNDWHKNYSPSTSGLRLTDAVRLHQDLVQSAGKTAIQFWEGCSSMEEVEQPIGTARLSECMAPPAISPSMWTYPGNLVCFMDRLGRLDLYRRHAFDRQAWWTGRLKLPETFLSRIPKGYDLSAVQVGANHIAMFSYQQYFQATQIKSPLGACWMVPKAELSSGKNVVSLPTVPLHYYKPFSAKDSLFVIGYNHHTDSNYKILSLKWDTPETASWQETDMKTLPLHWIPEVLMGDYPESLYREGTASICVAEDHSKIFITAPYSGGQNILTIDTETWDFHLESCAIPPVWGAALMHDHLNDRLILAGGLGHVCPEPIIRAVNLSTMVWQIHRPARSPSLGAYAGAFPIGPGSFAIIGGFWRTGHKNLNLQPSTSVIALHTTDCDVYRFETLLQKYAPVYFPDGVPDDLEAAMKGESGPKIEGSEDSPAEDAEFDV